MFIQFIFIFAILFVFFTNNLFSQNNLEIDTIRNFKIHKKYTYKFDNAKKLDANKFGFRFSKSDESVGPASILLNDSLVYITDVIHNSLKVINVYNGKIINNIIFDTTYCMWLRDIIIYNDLVYITSDRNRLYRITKDFKVIDEIEIDGEYTGLKDKYFIIVNKDTLLDTDRNYFILPYSSKLVKYEGKVDVKGLNIDFQRKGFKFTIDKNTLSFKNKYIVLNEKIPNVHNYYSGNNIDFNDTSLVYFSITKKTLTINYYQW